MATSSPIPAFFEPGAPPSPLPTLTAQTDLGYGTGAYTITAREELPSLFFNRIQATNPSQDLPPPSSRVRFQSIPTSDDSESDAESSVPSDDGKIAKPHGEAGRPHSGGYNLERTLAWRKATFKQLKVSHCYRAPGMTLILITEVRCTSS